ncbi:MAG: hypothetical protein RLY47_160 [Candidatus Parcubacteria bacterium]|jgi:small subunit ribosomal protein S9
MATATKKYIEAIGRRKTAVARVRVTLGGSKASFIVNDKPIEVYFPLAEHQMVARESLTATKTEGATVTVQTKGGGIHAQAEAIRLGIARALLVSDKEFRSTLKPAGYLMRDPRKVERKKPGLKKARKSPQWAKR